MGATKHALMSAMEHAGWPMEGTEVAMQVLENVGWADLADELCDRSERACDGWRGCLVEAGDGRGALCEPCPLTTLRDVHSDEFEGVAS